MADQPVVHVSITRWGWRRLCVARLQYDQQVEWLICIGRPLVWVGKYFVRRAEVVYGVE